MPESKVRKSAADKQKVKDHQKVVENRAERAERESRAAREDRANRTQRATRVDRSDRETLRKAKAPAQRRWVPPVFITVGLLGVLWLMIYYIAGYQIPPMAKLGNWNILIGMGLMAASFIIATLWK